MSADVEQDWQSFWVPIVAPGGVVDLEQVKRELFDYHRLIRDVPRILMEATGGRVSKPSTDVNVVIQLIDEALQKSYEQGLADAREETADE